MAEAESKGKRQSRQGSKQRSVSLGSDAGNSSGSESGEEKLELDGRKRAGWLERLRKRMPARPTFWRKDGAALTPKHVESLRKESFQVKEDATLEDLQSLAGDRSKSLEKVIATLEQPGFWRADEGEDYAIAAVTATLETDAEVYVKGWVLVKINSHDQEQERVCILTDRAFYTARYGYESGQVSKVRRHALEDYQYVRSGVLYASKWSVTGSLRNLGRKETKHYGFVLTLRDRKPGAVTKTMAKITGKEDQVHLYERGFRCLRKLEFEQQRHYMREVTWAVYAVTLRLMEQSVFVNPPVETELYRPSNVGADTWTLAYNAIGLGLESSKDKKAATSAAALASPGEGS